MLIQLFMGLLKSLHSDMKLTPIPKVRITSKGRIVRDYSFKMPAYIKNLLRALTNK